ncbi:MAG: hypothetical protein ACOYJQ_13250 [Pseudochelatococcus sp.]|jgi:chromosome segregation ATPase|uniref:hypothetical protein n=1 Tax=Pseudochelatococcus sp. TaxID=2020869 RepID=UPI003D8F08FD
MSTTVVSGSAPVTIAATTEEPESVVVPSASGSSASVSTTQYQVPDSTFSWSIPTAAVSIRSPTGTSDLGVSVAEVLAENEALRGELDKAHTISLSARIRQTIETTVASTAKMQKLEDEVAALEAQREGYATPRDTLQDSVNSKSNQKNTVESQIAAKRQVINEQNALIANLDSALAALDAGGDVSARDTLQAQLDGLTTSRATLQAELDALEEARNIDAGDSLQSITDAIDASLTQLSAELAALGEGAENDTARRALQEQIAVLSALKPALETAVADLAIDPEAGAVQTLEAFHTAVQSATDALRIGLESTGDEETGESEGTGETEEEGDSDESDIVYEISGETILKKQIETLERLATLLDSQLTALRGADESDEDEIEDGAGETDPADEAFIDPGAAEGLRLVVSALFDTVSKTQANMATLMSYDSYSASTALQQAIDELNAGIAALQSERDNPELDDADDGEEPGEIDDEAAQAAQEAYADDIAALQDLVALLEGKLSALPDTSGLSEAEALQAEIDALAEAYDAMATILGMDVDDETAADGVSARVLEFGENAASLLSNSAESLTNHLANVNDGEFIADRTSTLLGYSSVADALSGLVAPLESAIVAFGDDTVANTIYSLEYQIAAMDTSIATLQTEIDSIDAGASARQALANQLETVDAQTATVLADIAAIDAESGTRAELAGQLDALQARSVSLEAEIDALEPGSAERLTLEEQLAALQTDAASLQAEIDAIDARAAGRPALEAQLATLQTDAASLQAEIDAIDAANDTRLLLENQRNAATAAIGEANAAITTLTSQKNTLQSEITALNNQIRIYNTSIATIDTQLAAKETEYDALVSAAATDTETTRTQSTATASTLFQTLFDSILESLGEEFDQIKKSGNRQWHWGATAEERATQILDDGAGRPAAVYGDRESPAVKQHAQRIALQVAEIMDAVITLRSETEAQQDDEMEQHQRMRA